MLGAFDVDVERCDGRAPFPQARVTQLTIISANLEPARDRRYSAELYSGDKKSCRRHILLKGKKRG